MLNDQCSERPRQDLPYDILSDMDNLRDVKVLGWDKRSHRCETSRFLTARRLIRRDVCTTDTGRTSENRGRLGSRSRGRKRLRTSWHRPSRLSIIRRSWYPRSCTFVRRLFRLTIRPLVRCSFVRSFIVFLFHIPWNHPLEWACSCCACSTISVIRLTQVHGYRGEKHRGRGGKRSDIRTQHDTTTHLQCKY